VKKLISTFCTALALMLCFSVFASAASPPAAIVKTQKIVKSGKALASATPATAPVGVFNDNYQTAIQTGSGREIAELSFKKGTVFVRLVNPQFKYCDIYESPPIARSNVAVCNSARAKI
jgi:hypothetical protein